MAVETIWAGLRPSSIDDAPILGATGIDGLVVANRAPSQRHLLAPVTAAAIEALVAGGAAPPTARPFGLDRFSRAASHGRELEQAETVR